MRLIIAEKPSLARAIAAVLPEPRRQRDHIACGDDTVVTWCAGHILELAAPESYDSAFKEWRLEHIPIVPTAWQLAVTAPDLLRTIQTHLARADCVIHAGDPDREGQLLVDEVLAHLRYTGHVDRLLINDLNPPAVLAALAHLEPNARFRSLYEAAVARQRADWLFGLNLTRLYTLLGRAGGYRGVLSVGRVQTPLLGLIVRRDLEIERFRPASYFVITALVLAGGARFRATWVPGPEAQPALDEDGRLTSREKALAVQRCTHRRDGSVTNYLTEKKVEPQPLPYSLADLQAEAARRLGASPKTVLDACQSLYETHRLITYPRSDCAHLPSGQHAQAPQVLAAITRRAPNLSSLVDVADPTRRSRAWDDAKITAHHALIPTARADPGAALPELELALYDLIARRYVAQFYPAAEFQVAAAELVIAGELFRATGRTPVVDGWRVVELPAPPGDDLPAVDDQPPEPLPRLSVGGQVFAEDVRIDDKLTLPPKHFTDATLIRAMTGIARYVSDPRVREILRETDGIGTPATQAQIIQTLFDRHYVAKRGRSIISTPIGRALIEVLPAVATTPDMTALWEFAMHRIIDGELSLDAFLSGVLRQLRPLVDAAKTLQSLKVPAAAPSNARSPRPRQPRRRRGPSRSLGR